MNIVDMIIVGTLLDEIEHDSKKETKKPESENPVRACIIRHSMSVVFNDVDNDQMQKFIDFLDGHSCTYKLEENEFKISGNEAVLYTILIYLTNEFEEIALY